MTTQKRREAAKNNIKKNQDVGQNMSTKERPLAKASEHAGEQPEFAKAGDYYHIGVRDKSQYQTFRTQKVADKDGLLQVAGQRSNAAWDVVEWLLSKQLAHVEGGKLLADHHDAQEVLDNLGSTPEHVEGDLFFARLCPNVPEKDEPTEVQRGAHQEKIKKAKVERHKSAEPY